MRRWIAVAPLLLVAACAAPAETGTSSTVTASPTVSGPATALASVTTYGGLCPDGPCDTTFAVLTDGSWTMTRGTETAVGSIPAASTESLVAAVDATTMHTGDAFTGTCPIAYDGQAYRYTYTQDGVERNVDTCVTTVADDDPLAVTLQGMLQDFTVYNPAP